MRGRLFSIVLRIAKDLCNDDVSNYGRSDRRQKGSRVTYQCLGIDRDIANYFANPDCQSDWTSNSPSVLPPFTRVIRLNTCAAV